MLTFEDVLAAQDRVAETARHTPLDYSHTFSAMTGADIHLKLELFQRTGSFKIRGATNRIATLSEEQRENGVVTASAGNHAQGVALAATRIGVDSTIVMPKHAPISKVKATRSYGGEVVLHGEDYDEAAEKAHEIEREEGRTYVHAFDDDYVMAGQGTIGLEIYEDLPSVETVVVPIGGGGLISGIATALKGKDEDIRVVGVQAEGASSVAESLEKGHRIERDGVETIADGIATRTVGERTFEVITERVDEVVTVSDSEIAVALTTLLERSKTLAEGAGAVALAAVTEETFDYADDETIVPALCGGNIDLNTLTNVIMRGLVETGRYLKIRTVLKDRPGALEELVQILSAQQINIYGIEHDRTNRDVAMNDAEVELDLETRGPDHVDQLLAALRENGYEVEVLV
ncbi:MULTISPECIES: threonine ammonia-lyase [Haloarcula]|uniref:threonine ammonia-lyase n=1 Tax=Haloarcula pellucida TaxID=1427151 RepID=A0A830GP29_9EURY|nr:MULTISPECIES: threonine ammonia-lyase [Halomicroarcula]MBX0349311.1 threonine ammonia-lyase [Halomicroarcula pellucida]MDS0279103.1 threonine ammonia-lyase [Halomicroarcula sp. S1AR25-4]GGN99977.1 threonine ammonia-lyase [Halomicroarcula pellucida]